MSLFSDYMDIVTEECMMNPITEGFLKKRSKRKKKFSKRTKSGSSSNFDLNIKVAKGYDDISFSGNKPSGISQNEFKSQIEDEVKESLSGLKKAIKDFEKYTVDEMNNMLRNKDDYDTRSLGIAEDVIKFIKSKSNDGYAYITYLGNNKYEIVCSVDGSPSEVTDVVYTVNGGSFERTKVY